MRTTTSGIFLSSALVALLLAGCGAPATRTGAAEPVTLRAATGGGAGVGNDVMDALAEVTASGMVRVAEPADADQVTPGGDRTLELLESGAADIGVVRSGRLVAEGVESLRGLQAPFVVVSNDQAAAVAADPIADTAMADLDQLDLRGLALVPGGLRHPFGYRGVPLLGASDYQSATINAPVDAGAESIMTALGAEVDHSIGQDRTAAAGNGRLRGIDASLHQYGAVDRPAVVTTNVTFYSKFDVVVVREATWRSLNAAQQAELQSAAAAVRVAVPAGRGSEQEVFADWCREDGAGAARASDADLRSLHAALNPVTATLETDPVAQTIIERARALRTGTEDEPSDLTCPGEEPSAEVWRNLSPEGDQSVLDGTWRFAPSEAELLAAGLTADDARNNAIVWQVTLENGKGTASVGAGGHTCEWVFTFAGSRVLFDFTNGEACGGMAAGTYRRDGDTVTFDWTDPDDEYGLKLINGIFGTAVRVTG